MKKINYQKTAQRRARVLEKAGIDNNAVKAYRAMMKTAKTAKQKQKVARQFVHNPLSTRTGIKQEYKKKYGERPSDIKDASEQVDKTIKINDDTLRENLGSEVLHEVFTNQEVEGYSTTQARNALSRYMLSHSGEEFDVDDAINEVIDDIRTRIK